MWPYKKRLPVEKIKGKKIISLKIEDDVLKMETACKEFFEIFDDGQSCCEARYMETSDKLGDFIGATILDVKTVDGGETENAYGDVHEIQFLNIDTDKGLLQFATHNEHNGYYGGFDLVIVGATPDTKKAPNGAVDDSNVEG